MTKKPKKHDPKSEAAMIEALREPIHWEWQLYATIGRVTATDIESELVIAEFNLHDCYRKRAPLKGVMKRVRKAIQPKRRKGKK